MIRENERFAFLTAGILGGLFAGMIFDLMEVPGLIQFGGGVLAAVFYYWRWRMFGDD